MVQSKSDREKQKLITDKCQSLIEVLLKDEDNKYCVDCDAKGPRWASWNLGIFLCIRCAGIHRNLGVHISKVKSVNLDAWSPEHVAYVQRMGNSRARAIYEANLPNDFRRPQTDTALESFIRAKYEHKKYIAQDYVDPGPPPPAFNIDEEIKRMKEQKKSKNSNSSTIINRPIQVPVLPNPRPQPPTESSSAKNNKVKNSIPGLVDLETVVATEAAINNSLINTSLDVSSSTSTPTIATTNNNDNNVSIDTTKTATDSGTVQKVTAGMSALDLLMDLDLSGNNRTTTTFPPHQPMMSANTLVGVGGLNIEPIKTAPHNQSLIMTDTPPAVPSNPLVDFDFTSATSSPVHQKPPPMMAATQPPSGSGPFPPAEAKVMTKESILSLYSFGATSTANNSAGMDPFGMNSSNSFRRN